MKLSKHTAVCGACSGTREVTEPAREYTFMGRIFWTSTKQVACPACSVVMVRAVRTHRTSEQKSITTIRLERGLRHHQTVVTIAEGGVTGWESVYCDEYFLNTSRAKGWLACAGTPDRYDGLMIPAKEMRVALTQLGL